LRYLLRQGGARHEKREDKRSTQKPRHTSSGNLAKFAVIRRGSPLVGKLLAMTAQTMN
jgi:hypothetical protein